MCSTLITKRESSLNGCIIDSGPESTLIKYSQSIALSE